MNHYPVSLDTLLTMAVNDHASDLHLSAGLSPILRIQGELKKMELPLLTSEQLQCLLHSILNEAQHNVLMQELELDYAYTLTDVGRFRINIYHQLRGLAVAIRLIPEKIPTLASLQLPHIFYNFCEYTQGLILITGPTGAGKTSSLAALINHINQNQAKHIITIEDPIEFIHPQLKSLISQRELHNNTRSFKNALRAALREDPDIILVGELRDLESIHLALTAAETGHLVLATLHTVSAPKTIDRIIDIFPGNEKDMIRAMLSECLTAVVSQKFFQCPKNSRRAIFEILVCTPAIRNLIRENKIPQIYSVMQTGQASGMCTFEQYLTTLKS
ncbi:MAG TPA: type IV pilus twitching motility protein PilT [Gammaproteobacteria bacterium]|nr:type IV pilus twitching motility protein PilT [Gammaproteobacteria bacterium]